MRTNHPPRIYSLRQLIRDARALGLKHPKAFAGKLYNKQFDKALPHGGIARFERALRTGTLRLPARA